MVESLFIKVPKKDAEREKRKLIETKAYRFEIKPFSDSKYVYLPVVKEVKGYDTIRGKSKEYTNRTISLKEILKKLGLKNKQIKTISSYDTVGNIAILKITEDMEKYEKEIANALLKSNKMLKTVVKKTKEHHGVYRVQSVKWLAGKKNFNTLVRESGAIFKVRVGDMFFSPRLSFERNRIAKMIKPKSNVAVFFAGVAPFSIIIAKKQPKVNKVYSIELNPKAHKEAVENIKLNKVEDKVEAVCDDVNNFAKNIKDWADYVIMPLPKTSDLFLESAFKVVKKGTLKESGIISLYKFVPAKDPYSEIENQLKNFAKSKGYKLKILFKRQVRDFSPKIIQIVIDFKFYK